MTLDMMETANDAGVRILEHGAFRLTIGAVR
jgi:hypothetical protein